MTYITILIIVFVIGYLSIIFEHSLHINKSPAALIMAGFCWAVYAYGNHFDEHVAEELAHHLSEIAPVIFFLLAAMTIVEVIDAHEGFKVITDKIRSKNKVKLLWTVGFITFFLSAILDNLTTAIVMISLLRKLIRSAEDRKFFGGVVIISANSGGAFSPLGDVTTTMLWIDGQISASVVMVEVFLPSLVSMLVPLIYLSFVLKGEVEAPKIQLQKEDHEESYHKPHSAMIALVLGISALVFAPIFKSVFHLPPYLGILLSLGVMWLVVDLMHRNAPAHIFNKLSASGAISRIDTPSILFFFGILTAVSSLQSAGLLKELAMWLDTTVGNQDAVVMIIGVASAVIDNVPLVAASQGMYSLTDFPMDSKLWEFIAYCAGTGGSMLIIGSAAGVAVMGMEKIDFMWYVKKITWVALLGYFAGAFTYIALYEFMH